MQTLRTMISNKNIVTVALLALLTLTILVVLNTTSRPAWSQDRLKIKSEYSAQK